MSERADILEQFVLIRLKTFSLLPPIQLCDKPVASAAVPERDSFSWKVNRGYLPYQLSLQIRKKIRDWKRRTTRKSIYDVRHYLRICNDSNVLVQSMH